MYSKSVEKKLRSIDLSCKPFLFYSLSAAAAAAAAVVAAAMAAVMIYEVEQIVLAHIELAIGLQMADIISAEW